MNNSIQLRSGISVANLVDDGVERGRPALEFALPIGNGRQGRDDKVGSGVVFVLNQVADEADDLRRFAFRGRG